MIKNMVLFVTILLVLTGTASATYLDLTTQTTASGFMGNGFFIRTDAQSTGTGVIDSFVQLGGNQPEQGFNTTVNGTAGDNDNGSTNTFNHEIQLSNLGIVSNPYTGVLSYRFLLDVNESNNSSDRFISLDQLQVYRSATANFGTTAALVAGSTKLYDIDSPPTSPLLCRDPSGLPAAGGACPPDGHAGSGILLDYNFNGGSGSGDMFFYLPVSAFAAGSGDFIYIFSRFGDVGVDGSRNYGTSDGFEEWALTEGATVIPEPGFYGVLALGMAGLFLVARRRKPASN